MGVHLVKLPSKHYYCFLVLFFFAPSWNESVDLLNKYFSNWCTCFALAINKSDNYHCTTGPWLIPSVSALCSTHSHMHADRSSEASLAKRGQILFSLLSCTSAVQAQRPAAGSPRPSVVVETPQQTARGHPEAALNRRLPFYDASLWPARQDIDNCRVITFLAVLPLKI